MNAIILSDRENVIFNLRDINVMIDVDLAEMYDVTVEEIRNAVSTFQSRFPDDFYFALTEEETNLLKKHIARFKELGANSPKVLAFAEAGISMLSSVLHTEKALQISIAIMRSFGHYRSIIQEQDNGEVDVKTLDAKFTQAFQFLLQKIDAMSNPPGGSPMEPIGFKIR